MARHSKEDKTFTEALQIRPYPPEFVRLLTHSQAETDVGHPLPCGGLLFPEAGWLNPASLCKARIANTSVRLLANAKVQRIERTAGQWHAHAADGALLGSAPVVVCANAFEARAFPELAGLHFKKVKGQVSHVDSFRLPEIRRVLSRDGYLTPAVDGIRSLGATYEFNTDDPSLTEEGQRVNRARLPSLLASCELPAPSVVAQGRASFRSLTADRMPSVGALPDHGLPILKGHPLEAVARHPGLYGLLGMGSRGALWSTLAGEILASLICEEPLPVGRDLVQAIDPARFSWREITR